MQNLECTAIKLPDNAPWWYRGVFKFALACTSLTPMPVSTQRLCTCSVLKGGAPYSNIVQRYSHTVYVVHVEVRNPLESVSSINGLRPGE